MVFDAGFHYESKLQRTSKLLDTGFYLNGLAVSIGPWPVI